jgi:glycosyltransferase involved in cell wall biosynthesis
MNIVQITPGAGGMYCGNCFRDNAMVAAMRKAGHHALMVPLYLPMTLEEDDSSQGTPIFFGGINVYLEQKSSFFRKGPDWLHNLLARPTLLKWASGRAAKTRAADVGDLTLSMLRGEEGNQARELDELVGWLKKQGKPDVICLSNALLAGMIRRLRQELKTPVVCMLQGEDAFLDAMPEPIRTEVWKTLAERVSEAEQFIAPSRYFADLMTRRLNLDSDRVHVIHNGINLDGFNPRDRGDAAREPVLGYFARMCAEKGLDTLVDAFLLLKQRDRVKRLKLKVGGGCGPADEKFVATLRGKLQSAGVIQDTEFHPNLDRASKLELIRAFDVMSVPALYGEAFGLYLLEAWATGVPVVQPRHAAFPELVEATGGGDLCEPGDPLALAEAVERLLLDFDRHREMSDRARRHVHESYSVEAMSRNVLQCYEKLLSSGSGSTQNPDA